MPRVTMFRKNPKRFAGPDAPVRRGAATAPRAKSNPRKAKTAVVLSRRAIALSYIHAEGKRDPYIHKFARGVTVQLLADGSVRLVRADRKPLWKNFED